MKVNPRLFRFVRNATTILKTQHLALQEHAKAITMLTKGLKSMSDILIKNGFLEYGKPDSKKSNVRKFRRTKQSKEDLDYREWNRRKK